MSLLVPELSLLLLLLLLLLELASSITCNTALEQFYEDKEYIYYFPCEKSKYVIVIYSNGYQETVKSSLEYGDITIEDLEKNNIEFIKQKKDMSNWQITISARDR